MNNPLLAKALQIAKENLRVCYDELGIVAGRGHYDDYWTRDAAFGCLGALELGDYPIVEKHLTLLTSLQRKDGMIPFLVRRYLPGLPLLNLKIPIKPQGKFRSHKALYLSEVIDSNPYFVIVFSKLLEKTNDQKLLEKYLPNLESVLRWCLKKMEPSESLAHEGLIAGWNDGIYKTGKTLITNVLFCKAFRNWENICSEHQVKLQPEFTGIAEKIKTAIQNEFWNGNYFSDWIDYKRHDHFDSNANFLAILWDIATTEQAEKIIEFALKNLVDKPFVKTVYPPYPWHRVETFNRLVGMADYINGKGMHWPEPTCLFILCLNKIGKQKLAEEFLTDLAKIIVKHNGVYEVYDKPKKEPVRRLNYRAEFPYARGTALFILAHNQFQAGS